MLRFFVAGIIVVIARIARRVACSGGASACRALRRRDPRRRKPPRRSRARGAAADLARRRVAHRREPGRHGPLDEQRALRRVPRQASARRAPISRSPAPTRRERLKAAGRRLAREGRRSGAAPAGLQDGRAGVEHDAARRRSRRSSAARTVTRIGDPGQLDAGTALRRRARRHASLRADARAAPSPTRRWASSPK